MCWYVVPLVGGRYPHQCRKHSASDPAELVDKKTGICLYPIPVGTKHKTCKHPLTDCGCMWCRYGVELVL